MAAVWRCTYLFGLGAGTCAWILLHFVSLGLRPNISDWWLPYGTASICSDLAPTSALGFCFISFDLRLSIADRGLQFGVACICSNVVLTHVCTLTSLLPHPFLRCSDGPVVDPQVGMFPGFLCITRPLLKQGIKYSSEQVKYCFTKFTQF